MSYTVVWFKRDLRTADHAPLAQAATRGPVLCLYVVEPSLWAQPDASLRHYRFLTESLQDLADMLRSCGVELQIAVGEVVEILDRLHALAPFSALTSHEETGNDHTFSRDRAVGRWCLLQGVEWREWPQHGVVRRLSSRTRWSDRWHTLMAAPRVPAPARGTLTGHALPWPNAALPTGAALGLSDTDPALRQRGGRTHG